MKKRRAQQLLYMLLALCFCSGSVSAQAISKETEWQAITVQAQLAFALKGQEGTLSGLNLNRKIGERMRAFRDVSRSVDAWTDKYYPDGDAHPTPGYVLAKFISVLYIEYAGSTDFALTYYKGLISEYLYKLFETHQPFPKYKGVSVDAWVTDRIAVLKPVHVVLVQHHLTTDTFQSGILQSVTSDVEVVTAQVNYLLASKEFAHVLVNDDEKIFIVKQKALAAADSAGAAQPVNWARTYLETNGRGFDIPFKRDTLQGLELYSFREPDSIREKIFSGLRTIRARLTQQYLNGRPADTIIIATHGFQNGQTDTLFQRQFGESKSYESVSHIRLVNRKGRIMIFNQSLMTAQDTSFKIIGQQAASEWIILDFKDALPPVWFWGIALLQENSIGKYTDSFHLYYLQTAIRNNTLPPIEHFVMENYFSKMEKRNFLRGYWKYFWLFLEDRQLAGKVYQAVRETKLALTDSVAVKLLERVSGIPMAGLNAAFREFLQSRSEEGIPANEKQRRNSALNFIFKETED